MAEREEIEEELRRITQGLRKDSGNGQQIAAREGVAEDLAKFIEQHADDLLKEAEEHRTAAREFANEIRQRTDQKVAELRAFTNSVKASKTGMAEVRTKFLESRTTEPRDDMDERPSPVER
jgi:quinol monooxygenase YgiN